jgi:hypothetical protein
MQARLTRAGGRNLAGRPTYRLIWGGGRLDDLGFQRYAFAPRLLNRWIVEKWLDGDYKFVTALEGRENEFAPLNLKAIDLVVDLVEKSRDFSDFDRREYFRKEQERRERDYEGFSDAVLGDAMRPMNGAPAVYFGGTKRKAISAAA